MRPAGNAKRFNGQLSTNALILSTNSHNRVMSECPAFVSHSGRR